LGAARGNNPEGFSPRPYSGQKFKNFGVSFYPPPPPNYVGLPVGCQ